MTPIKYTYIVRIKGSNPVVTDAYEDLSKLLRAAYRLAKEHIKDPAQLADERIRIKDAINGVREHVAELERQKRQQIEDVPAEDFVPISTTRLNKGDTALIPGRDMTKPASKDYAYIKYRKQLKKLQMENQQ